MSRKPIKISIEEVFAQLPEELTPGHTATFHGVTVPTDIINLYLYKQKGCDCKGCNAKGSHFYIEKFGVGNKVYNNWHLNLYAINEYGHEVMVTKDHILAKSAGGSDDIVNLQPLCRTCNTKKGCKPMAVLVKQLESRQKNLQIREANIVEAEQQYGYSAKTIHRLKQRYDIDLTETECKKMAELVGKKGHILCDLSCNKSIRSYIVHGKLVNFIYNSELGLLETAIEADYDSVKFKYLPAFMTEEFAIETYNEICDSVKTNFKRFDTDKETAIYFNSLPYSQLLFCMWKKPEHFQRSIWRCVTEKFKSSHRVHTNTNEEILQ